MADTDPTFGERLRHLRERRGLSREVFGGLVGRSGEWVKAVERGRIHMPRVPMLLRIAEVLRVNDLSDLTGGQQLPVESFSKGSHDRTPAVADAMLSAAPSADVEPDLSALVGRLDDAWRRWVTMPDQKSSVADLLPGLITDARAAVRALDGVDRRRALVELGRAYSLAQCFLAWQPAAELVWLAADRAMAAAQDADDPLAMAAAAWYYGEVYRSSGQAERALSVVLESAALLDPAASTEQRARWGHLQVAAALAEAQTGRPGDAWRRWDQASEAAEGLGSRYSHPWLRFGRADVDAWALRLDVRLFRPGDAVRRADQLDLSALSSPGRRAIRLLDVAEAHQQRAEPVGVVHMIGKAHRESAETVRFNLFARHALAELSERRSAVRQDARELAGQIGLAG
jgi:transcriptional regulator with XRE-family HTH domain